ncbi:hypothetical protein QVD17_15647 [Tagetes erecta]|uniref:Uncharacterized protein n=1 Tax=Tagetes erecta TaxID=13708 RepID=A0AAD8KPJ9_TARER|nr:hypothetical protein QVD17_15647 [Tagetes erecta]
MCFLDLRRFLLLLFVYRHVESEKESYVAHINSYVRDDPSLKQFLIDPSTNALFELARDGVLLWLLFLLVILVHPDRTSGRSQSRKTPKHVELLEENNVVEELMGLAHVKVLLKWMGFHLKKVGYKKPVMNFSSDLKFLDEEKFKETVLNNNVDSKSARATMLVEPKKLIEANPMTNPDIKTLFVYHSCGQPKWGTCSFTCKQSTSWSLPKAGGFPPLAPVVPTPLAGTISHPMISGSTIGLGSPISGYIKDSLPYFLIDLFNTFQ